MKTHLGLNDSIVFQLQGLKCIIILSVNEQKQTLIPKTRAESVTSISPRVTKSLPKYIF